MKYTLYKKGLPPFHTEYAVMVDRQLGLGWSFENPDEVLETIPEAKGKTVFQVLKEKKMAGKPTKVAANE